jgi:hypothetical protein
MNLINKVLKIFRSDWGVFPRPFICKDGLSLSIQASVFHYCTPRDNDGPYISVEIGFPSKICPELLPYAEDILEPTHTVYSYVPIDIVEKLIKDHGGLVSFRKG